MRTLLTILLLTVAVLGLLGFPELYQVSKKNTQITQVRPEVPVLTINTKVGPLTLEGFKTSISEYLSVSSENSGATSVFMLEDPDRVVMDFFGEDVEKSYTVDINSSYIKQVRIGKHPNKARVVLDLQPNNLNSVKFSSKINSVDINTSK